MAVLVGLALVIAPTTALAVDGPSSIPDRGFPEVDGTVASLVRSGDTLYVGGRFQHIGRPSGPAVQLSTADGSLERRFPGFSRNSNLEATVYAVASDGAGGWFIGGSFPRVDGLGRSNVVHLLADGSVDPDFHVEVDRPVEVLARTGDTLWMGGGFELVDRVRRHNLAAVDLTTGELLPWLPRGTDGFRVHDFDVEGSRLYVAGEFGNVDGRPRGRGAAIDWRTGELLDWDPRVQGKVTAVSAQSGRVYLGGEFDRVAGTTRRNLAALDPQDASLVESFQPDVGFIDDVEAVDGRVFSVSGDLRAFDATTGARLEGFDRVRTQDGPLDRDGNRLYIAEPTVIDGEEVDRRVVAIDHRTGESSLTGRPPR